MVLLTKKLARPDDSPTNASDALSASFRNFRTKVANFIAQNLFGPEPDPEFLSLKGLSTCFELINATNRALAKLAAEMDYPATRWGGKLTDEYLSYTLTLMKMLNAVSSSVSHLSRAKLFISHAISQFEKSPPSAGKHLQKIPRRVLEKEFRFERPIMTKERDGSEEERLVLRALNLSEKIGLLVLAFVVSALCGDAKPYMEVRKFADGLDDSMIKELDLRFCEELAGPMKEVKDVNSAIDRVSAATSNASCCTEHVNELKGRLKVLEKSIGVTDKQANDLFSQVLSARNNLLDNIRFQG